MKDSYHDYAVARARAEAENLTVSKQAANRPAEIAQELRLERDALRVERDELLDAGQRAANRADDAGRQRDELLEALKSIQRYGLDTLSGRVDGPDDREWQRQGVNEMTKRARIAIEMVTPAARSGS